jgi:membrane-associated phospholipid phosphatase
VTELAVPASPGVSLSAWRWPRVLGALFAVQVSGLWLTGTVAALQLHRSDLGTAAGLAALTLLGLWRALLADNTSGWATWRGPWQFLASWMVFPLFRGIHDAFIHHSADVALLAIDNAIWGGQSLPDRLLTWERPGLSELFSAGYLAFFGIVLVPVIIYGFRRRTPEAQLFFNGLTLMYAFGFLGYVLVPASGPFLAFPDRFPYPLHGGPLTAALTALVQKGITGMDVFPSLHSGISAFVLGFLLLRRRWCLAALLFPVVITLIVATLYLRYHYGVDLICGLMLAAAVLLFLSRTQDIRS